MKTNYPSKVIASVACFLFAAGAIFAYARSKSERSQRPPEDKKLDLVVQFNADVPIEHAIEFEKDIASKTIVPFLRSRGYEIGAVYSLTEISVKNGSPRRALLNAMARDPQKDSSRIVFVTIFAEPAEWPGKVISSVVVLDSLLTDIKQAQTLQLQPKLRFLWTYEEEPMRLSIDDTIAAFPDRVRTALATYDLQYQDKARTGDYPNPFPLNRARH